MSKVHSIRITNTYIIILHIIEYYIDINFRTNNKLH